MLAPFRVRAFRFQWPADLLTNCAFEMETIILGWWIYTETGSVTLSSDAPANAAKDTNAH